MTVCSTKPVCRFPICVRSTQTRFRLKKRTFWCAFAYCPNYNDPKRWWCVGALWWVILPHHSRSLLQSLFPSTGFQTVKQPSMLCEPQICIQLDCSAKHDCRSPTTDFKTTCLGSTITLCYVFGYPGPYYNDKKRWWKLGLSNTVLKVENFENVSFSVRSSETEILACAAEVNREGLVSEFLCYSL